MIEIDKKFDHFYQERAEAIEKIRLYKLAKLINEHKQDLPSGMVDIIHRLIANPNDELVNDLAIYCEAFGYVFEFQRPAHENLETTPTEAGGYIMQLNLNPADYKLVLKKVVAEV